MIGFVQGFACLPVDRNGHGASGQESTVGLGVSPALPTGFAVVNAEQLRADSFSPALFVSCGHV